MKKLLNKIKFPLMYIGVGIIVFCVYAIGDKDGDGKIDATTLMYIGGVCCAIAGFIVIFTGEDKTVDKLKK